MSVEEGSLEQEEEESAREEGSDLEAQMGMGFPGEEVAADLVQGPPGKRRSSGDTRLRRVILSALLSANPMVWYLWDALVNGGALCVVEMAAASPLRRRGHSQPKHTDAEGTAPKNLRRRGRGNWRRLPRVESERRTLARGREAAAADCSSHCRADVGRT